MDIYLFKKDLDLYSKSDIQLLAKMYELTGDLNDLKWQIALRHYQSRKQMTTGPNLDISYEDHHEGDDIALFILKNLDLTPEEFIDVFTNVRFLGFEKSLAYAKEKLSQYDVNELMNILLFNIQDVINVEGNEADLAPYIDAVEYLLKDPRLKRKHFVSKIKQINDNNLSQLFLMPDIYGIRLFTKPDTQPMDIED